MAQTIRAEFASRRDAEMAVEHLVQEHGIDRGAVEIVAASDENTAGTRVDGADWDHGREKTDTDGSPALNGKIAVSANVEASQAEAVVSSFETYGGTGLAR